MQTYERKCPNGSVHTYTLTEPDKAGTTSHRWATKDGTQIWIYEIEDSHIDNLIPFIQRKDPENKTNWIDVFRAEKRYRQLKAKLPSMKAELFNMEMMADECL